MLTTLVEAGDRIAVGVGLAVLLWLVGRLAGALVRRRYLALQRPSFAHVMGRVVTLALALVGVLIAVTVIFPTVKPVDVLGSLGFFSIAVGFAFRDILENLLAGLLLLFRAPFRTRDEIEVVDARGHVIEINLRETVLRTYDGRQVLIPNSTVYKNAITVQTGYETVRDEATVRVAHGTDLEQARHVGLQALLGSARRTRRTCTAGPRRGARWPHDRPAPALLDSPQQAEVRRVRDSVLRAVVLAYGAARIEMPTDILQLEGSDSLAAALRSAQQDPG